ncbi:MAG: UvrD-helicase domain-containing protein [Simkaniaceae bacterium]|nr:MAG: UvrD-helicase domain-containing protein [Simkaniaceae bacterium]
MAKLNPNQQKAVTATEGRVLILAGAGSGKTRVLVHRIAHLIREKNVPPSSILGLTFTNKAATEMRDRVAKLVRDKEAKEVFLSTFHSFCMRILRSEIHRLGFTQKFTLYDEKDMRRLIMQVALEIFDGEELSLEPIIQAISYLKGKGLSSDDLPKSSDPKQDAFIKEVYDALRVAMRAYNALDFDSLLTLTVELFETFPDILEKYQDQFRYIMIDEYQDTNPIQYRLASLLSKKYGNLCVVGDDDQSIYAWRGAEIEHILSFPAKTTIKLEQNYRSTSHILKAANAVIRNNVHRHDKILHANAGTGETLEIFNAPTEQDEVDAVIERLLKFKEEKNYRWKEMAILYRSNNLARPFELSLMQTVWRNEGQWVRGIPYQVFGGTEFFERSEIKDLMAYLRIIANPKDQEALLRIVNYPRRGISDKTLDTITQFNRREKLPLLSVMKKIAAGAYPELILTSRGTQGIGNFMILYEEMVKKFETVSLSEGLKWLIEKTNYKDAIFTEVKSDKMRELKWENVQACISALQTYEKGEKTSLHDFLSSTMLDNRKHDRKDRFGDDKLNLMTFHSAKGLEFPAVFLVGLEDHLIPHMKSQTKEGIEEERRLLYVAITRAMEALCLSMSRKRPHHGKMVSCNPSRFLFEIPKDILKVTSWK